MRSVVQLYPGPPLYRGAVAQLGERLVCNQEATGSIPVSSTRTSVDEATTGNSLSASRGDRSCGLDTMARLLVSGNARAGSVSRSSLCGK
jgi:hypothetical protein